MICELHCLLGTLYTIVSETFKKIYSLSALKPSFMLYETG